MAALGRFLRTIEGGRLAFWCPGCEGAHQVKVEPPHEWGWNRSIEAPTFTPSVLVTGVQWEPNEHFHHPSHNVEPGGKTVCHSFVTDGKIQFLGDCTHKMANQTVPLPEWPQHPDDKDFY